MTRAVASLSAAALMLLAPACAQDEAQSEESAVSDALPAEVAAAPDDWREVAPEHLLRMDTDRGRILIEFAPDFAPNHVERISTLAGEGFYDGIEFHRVIEGFMAQGGDPTGTGGGGSRYPDLRAEFTARVEFDDEVRRVAEAQGTAQPIEISYRNGFVVAHQPTALAAMTGDNRVNAFMLHCAGVTSMARTGNPHSANSQFFLMRGASPHLDAQYTTWGRVVHGLDVVLSLAVGEPPAQPSRILEARVMSELPEGERDRAWVMRTSSESFASALEAQLEAQGQSFDPCEWPAPSAAALAE